MKTVSKILLVDDSPIVRERLKIMVEEALPDCIVYEAQNRDQGSASFDRIRPDAVILDIHLPDGSGIDLLARIKSIAPLVRVIMLTNYAYAQYEHKCKNLGADYFLDKSKEYDRIREIFETTPIDEAV
ncbi:response regulator transcription factor [bacterium]|nr:response regulator transcription factor [bacterium]